jgi:hypothetical protein
VEFRNRGQQIRVKARRVKRKEHYSLRSSLVREDEEMIQKYTDVDVLRLMGLTGASSQELP